MTRSVGNIAISASAGTGKTFQLAHRYIRLLSLEVAPNRISALTFSRKAAGEIFESIVENLSDAASDQSKAEQVAGIIGDKTKGAPEFMACLKRFLSELHSLNIGTLDSFMIGVVRAFPLELGVAPDFSVFDSDGAASRLIRQKALTRILNPAGVGVRAQKKFLDAFKQATFGYEEKDMGANLDNFITSMKTFYNMAPQPELWGNDHKIWPEGNNWQENIQELEKAADEVRSWIEKSNAHKTLLKSLDSIITIASTYNNTSLWNPKIENAVFKRLLSQLPDLEKGGVNITYSRKEYHLPGYVTRNLACLISNLISAEITRLIKQTKGIFKVLSEYSGVYSELSLGSGQLTFEDAQNLLGNTGESKKSMVISREQSENRLYIDYRLNCKLDHWLLDEFQDTSNTQWKSLENLASEVVQDNTGRRSFFYVGDVKQAIYGWRGGNHRLFKELADFFGRNIEQIPLTQSFRSAQPIIDTVNMVFGNLTSDKLPDRTVQEWNSYWSEHTCNKSHVPENGYACILTMQKPEKPTEPNKAVYSNVAGLLKDINPLSKGLSVAALVRTNKEGKSLVNTLNSECPGIPAIHEGKAAIRDNPLVELIISMIRLASHPGDTFAWRHLEMSPLMPQVRKLGYTRQNIAQHLQNMIHDNGFRKFVRHWTGVLGKVITLDRFASVRAHDLVAAAEEFDSNHDPDADTFIGFIDDYKKHEEPEMSAVRVMTFHQAKGLDFDVVILPDLISNSLFKPRLPDILIKGGPESPEWVLKAPRKTVAEADPAFLEAMKEETARLCFGELCALYVGITRPKQALYMFAISDIDAETAGGFLLRRLSGSKGLEETQEISIPGSDLSMAYERGDRNWHKPLPQLATGTIEEPAESTPFKLKKRALERLEPSKTEKLEPAAAFIFDPARRHSLEFGTMIHGLFEKVQWLEDCDIDALINQWKSEQYCADQLKSEVAAEFRRAISDPEIKRSLSKQCPLPELWKEKRFELILDHKLVSGIFDRVTLNLEPDGSIKSAVILDFKSDRAGNNQDIKQLATRHLPQMKLYKDALQKILGIQPDRISLELLFTHLGTLINVDLPQDLLEDQPEKSRVEVIR